jgi:hypothetical protein
MELRVSIPIQSSFSWAENMRLNHFLALFSIDIVSAESPQAERLDPQSL